MKPTGVSNSMRALLLVLLPLISLAPRLGRPESIHPLFGCDPPTNSLPFCNPDLPIPERAQDLVSRLSTEEKIAQLSDSAPPIPRLGVPAYEWWSESLHGVSRHGRGFRFNATFNFNGSLHYGSETIRFATMFPQVILSAASFDSHLWFRIAQAIATEARAMFNAAQGKGMTLWAPNINIFRDPRWGRGQETPGEDPLVGSTYAVSYVRGLQGFTYDGATNCPYIQASACCKHYTAHDLDNWHGVTRYLFDATVTKQDLADTFQPAFQSCVQDARASSIMCAYNRVNGVPSCANRDLLTNVARDQWGFDGYITSDCNAVSIIYESQGYADTPEDAVADALNAGMDVECGTYTQKHAKAAIEQKKVTEKQIDQALQNLFIVRMRLGLFDRKTSNKLFGFMGPKQVCSKEHQALALEAARNGIVLLKNTRTLLPLSYSTTDSLGVIGPNADSVDVLLGNYEGFPCKTVTPLEGLRSYIMNVSYHSGCNTVNCSFASIDDAIKVAKEVDYVILVMGLDQTQEKEKMDREELVLPGKQQTLITTVANVAKNPVVLVLLCGGPVDVSFAEANDKIGSILWSGYPGQAGGTAIAEVIFGDHNPGGRLPMTWYPQEFVKIPMTDMRMRPDEASGYPGRTYRFYRGKKVFEFGYGLSYSNYSYMFTSVSRDEIHVSQFLVGKANSNNYVMVSALEPRSCEEMKILVAIEARNEGEMVGEHPVLLFLRPSKQTEGSPLKQLIGFQRVKLKGGAAVTTEFVLNPCDHFSTANEDGLMVIREDVYNLVVGENKTMGFLFSTGIYEGDVKTVPP
ncbi:hypothetical protein V2J09_021245 [Rumex salicifolius]